VDLLPSDFELTYSHDVSVAEILAAGYDAHQRLQVAFVSDETKDTNTDHRLLIIRSDELKTKIVQDALVFTPKFVQDQTADEIESVKELVKSITGQGTFNITTPQAWLEAYGTNWWESYEEIGKWIGVFNGNKGLESAEFTVPEAWWKSDINKWWNFYEIGKWIENFNGTKPLMSAEITIDQIIRRINNYNKHNEKPARVALVLSGGGAKCAYQLGAVEIIEEKLKEAQKKNKSSEPAIDLVVGTSGGAINALTIAAAVTKDDAGRQKLRTTWENFGQSEILKPSNFVRRLLGFTLGFIFSLVAINIAYNRRQRASTVLKSEKNIKPAWLRKIVSIYRQLPWFEKLGIVLLVLSLVLFLLGTKRITLTSSLEAQTLLRWHWFIHIAEYGRQIVRWAAFGIVIFGVLLTFDRSIAARQQAYAALSRKLMIPAVGMVVILFFLLPFATLYTTVQLQNTLFVSSGIDEKMAVEMPNLLGCDGASGSLSERLAQISSKIINQGLIKRDLVITGSVLSSGSAPKQSDAPRQATNETDLYFIYTAGSQELQQSLRRDNRFVSLRDSDNASILLDAVIGSGSIFPAFEPKTLTKVKRVMDNDATAMKDVSIIDGGFVHNSPIEAAVKLQATHIIMIEASPEYPPSTRVNLLSNSIAAFNHLFTQAQLLDARSRREAEIFTLRPHQEPFLCTVDFGKHYILEAMKYGGEDVKDTTRPRFVRQPRPSGL
jgi:predicted acylesterase/phospholipase RssA